MVQSYSVRGHSRVSVEGFSNSLEALAGQMSDVEDLLPPGIEWSVPRNLTNEICKTGLIDTFLKDKWADGVRFIDFWDGALDGSEDCSEVFAYAANLAAAHPSRRLILPHGTLLVTPPITILGISIVGSSAGYEPGTVLKLGARPPPGFGEDPRFSFTCWWWVRFENIYFDHQDNEDDYTIDEATLYSLEVVNCWFYQSKLPIRTSSGFCRRVVIRGVTFEACSFGPSIDIADRLQAERLKFLGPTGKVLDLNGCSGSIDAVTIETDASFIDDRLINLLDCSSLIVSDVNAEADKDIYLIGGDTCESCMLRDSKFKNLYDTAFKNLYYTAGATKAPLYGIDYNNFVYDNLTLTYVPVGASYLAVEGNRHYRREDVNHTILANFTMLQEYSPGNYQVGSSYITNIGFLTPLTEPFSVFMEGNSYHWQWFHYSHYRPWDTNPYRLMWSRGDYQAVAWWPAWAVYYESAPGVFTWLAGPDNGSDFPVL